MKKIVAVLAVFLAVAFLAGCGGAKSEPEGSSTSQPESTRTAEKETKKENKKEEMTAFSKEAKEDAKPSGSTAGRTGTGNTGTGSSGSSESIGAKPGSSSTDTGTDSAGTGGTSTGETGIGESTSGGTGTGVSMKPSEKPTEQPTEAPTEAPHVHTWVDYYNFYGATSKRVCQCRRCGAIFGLDEQCPNCDYSDAGLVLYDCIDVVDQYYLIETAPEPTYGYAKYEYAYTQCSGCGAWK